MTRDVQVKVSLGKDSFDTKIWVTFEVFSNKEEGLFRKGDLIITDDNMKSLDTKFLNIDDQIEIYKAIRSDMACIDPEEFEIKEFEPEDL